MSSEEFIPSRLKEERLRRNLTQPDVAAICNVSKRTVIEWEKDTPIPSDKLAKLHSAGFDTYYILTGTVAVWWHEAAQLQEAKKADESQRDEAMAKGFTLVPRYDIKGSMGGGQLIHSEQVVDHLAFRTEWVRSELRANPANLVLISAVGDSMEPSLSSGDLLLVDKSEYKIRDDAIYVISVNGSLLVKRVQMLLDGTVIIRSDNPAYQIQTVKQPDIEQLKIVGRVVWIGRRV